MHARVTAAATMHRSVTVAMIGNGPLHARAGASRSPARPSPCSCLRRGSSVCAIARMAAGRCVDCQRTYCWRVRGGAMERLPITAHLIGLSVADDDDEDDDLGPNDAQ